MFDLKSEYKPSGDQPKAIKKIEDNFSNGKKTLTLLGATGTGKTFTMANIIKSVNKPTLIISHNKTLAAQLATEFKYFFPNNAVHYFVSYFDYYQPEAYLPERDIYIEKESMINKEIEMFRLGTMSSLLSREDVIVVSSVSALYGIGSKEIFEKNTLFLEVGKVYDFDLLKRQLISMQYKPVQSKIEVGMFDFRGEILDVYSSVDKLLYRMIFDYDKLEMIQVKDMLTFKDLGDSQKITIWPANQFLQNLDDLDNILALIKNEMELRVAELKKQGYDLEATRLFKRVIYDIRMIKETGFVNGIENYSPYFDKRLPGQPPNTLFSYFPDDMLVIIDESHMSIPQLKAMPSGDASRKKVLIDHGFRLPSAIDHRPIKFGELEMILGWKSKSMLKTNSKLEASSSLLPDDSDIDNIIDKQIAELKSDNVNPELFRDQIKSNAKTLFVSATPGKYELDLSENIIQQIIRPTGLLDPITYIYPKSGDYQVLIDSLDKLKNKKPQISDYLGSYASDIDFRELFFGEKK